MRNPVTNPWVPARLWACGISSSTATYSMAPAAKLSSHGSAACADAAANTTRIPNTGSTLPDSIPLRNALLREQPCCRSGSAMAAPSGKF